MGEVPLKFTYIYINIYIYIYIYIRFVGARSGLQRDFSNDPQENDPCALQGYLTHKKLPCPPRTTVRP